MATLKTPGVYVEEITKFPPSVAPVATAIPAFIGYTEKATELVDDDLHLIPKRITSMLEYEQYFGQAFEEPDIDVEITSDGRILVDNETPAPYRLYYSLQLYFANGGGPCYIVSCGIYSDELFVLEDEVGGKLIGFMHGLDAIRRQDEPTLLLFPEAVNLPVPAGAGQFASLQQSALQQCADLQDRFTILDLYFDTPNEINNFRTNIGVNNLKYGAAYYPYLDTILNFNYRDEDVSVEDASNSDTQQEVQTLFNQINDVAVEAIIGGLQSTYSTIDATDPITPALIDQVRSQTQQITTVVANYESIFLNLIELGTEGGAASQASDLQLWFDTNMAGMVADLNSLQETLNTTESRTVILNNLNSNSINYFGVLGGNAIDAPSTFDFVDAIATTIVGPTGRAFLLNAAIQGATPSNFTTLNLLKNTDNDLYNRIKAAISAYPVTLPPSSAMAGIYARVDNAVGVWKAPANETVAYVQQPTQLVTNEDQEDMNVHSTGKSVNAIRTFVGKGTLVWGARTLAGNDNEWRYISVRRFFSFVEESVSEATEQFVFEPNTANTWVRVRGLIENFLLQQWKAGALAGSRPEDAYYVRIGLGQTMTAQDVLEGRMIVEIGMAAVRPAEFIVLRFSHKMQEA